MSRLICRVFLYLILLVILYTIGLGAKNWEYYAILSVLVVSNMNERVR